MRVVSVNVGLPRKIEYKGREIETGIFKEPVEGRVAVRRLNLDGDRQADLSVHGGPEKAVYAYPAEHYEDWKNELPGIAMPFGMFGENLTVEGFEEEAINIGDRFRFGSALLMVTQPRVPCYKLAAKFGRDDMIKRFLESGRSGFYLSVIEEGEVAAGDPVELVSRDPGNVTVSDLARIYTRERDNRELMARALRVEALAADGREFFLELMAQ